MCHEVLFLLQLQEGVAEVAGEVTCSRNDARGYGHHGFCILCGALSSEVSSVLEQEGKHLTVDSSDKPQLQVLEAVEHCREICGLGANFAVCLCKAMDHITMTL